MGAVSMGLKGVVDSAISRYDGFLHPTSYISDISKYMKDGVDHLKEVAKKNRKVQSGLIYWDFLREGLKDISHGALRNLPRKKTIAGAGIGTLISLGVGLPTVAAEVMKAEVQNLKYWIANENFNGILEALGYDGKNVGTVLFKIGEDGLVTYSAYNIKTGTWAGNDGVLNTEKFRNLPGDVRDQILKKTGGTYTAEAHYNTGITPNLDEKSKSELENISYIVKDLTEIRYRVENGRNLSGKLWTFVDSVNKYEIILNSIGYVNEALELRHAVDMLCQRSNGATIVNVDVAGKQLDIIEKIIYKRASKMVAGLDLKQTFEKFNREGLMLEELKKKFVFNKGLEEKLNEAQEGYYELHIGPMNSSFIPGYTKPLNITEWDKSLNSQNQSIGAVLTVWWSENKKDNPGNNPKNQNPSNLKFKYLNGKPVEEWTRKDYIETFIALMFGAWSVYEGKRDFDRIRNESEERRRNARTTTQETTTPEPTSTTEETGGEEETGGGTPPPAGPPVGGPPGGGPPAT